MKLLTRKNRKAEATAANGAKVQAPELDKLLGSEDTVDVTDIIEEADKLQAHLEAEALADDLDDEPAPMSADERWLAGVKNAQTKLETFELSERAHDLLEAACDNVASNTGAGIEDRLAAAAVQDRAALFVACDNDLSKVIEVLVTTLGPKDAPGQIYSACFSVQKAANFVANLQYRRALDGRGGAQIDVPSGTAGGQRREDGTRFFVDPREEHREPPVGLGSDDEAQYDADGERIIEEHTGEPATETAYEAVVTALQDLHIYLQLVTEAHGWDTQSPMPYMAVMNSDGTFSSVFDAMHCLDIMDVRAQESRIRRQERQAALLSKALAGAKAALAKAGARRTKRVA